MPVYAILSPPPQSHRPCWLAANRKYRSLPCPRFDRAESTTPPPEHSRHASADRITPSFQQFSGCPPEGPSVVVFVFRRLAEFGIDFPTLERTAGKSLFRCPC